MSSATYKSSYPGSLADKAKLHAVQGRRATPDSEALASSDEDHDHVQPTRAAPAHPFAGARRPSTGWTRDIQPTTRKFSLPGVSLSGSHPPTPTADQSQSARSGGSSFPWNPSVFSNPTEGRRGSTSHLREVVHSPTSVDPITDKPLVSPTDDTFGFFLEENNTPRKSVRSQSYTVGQHEQAPFKLQSSNTSLSLRHRPSKPSLLREPASSLSQLREDEYDEVESSNGSEQGVKLPAGYWDSQQKGLDRPLLKQAVVDNARSRHRAAATGSPISSQRRRTTPNVRNMSFNDSDFAIDELDDAEQFVNDHDRAALTRRFSEHVGTYQHDSPVDHIMDSPGTTRGLSGQRIIPHGLESQSRRHSFATYSSHHNAYGQSTLADTYEEDETTPAQAVSPAMNDGFSTSEYKYLLELTHQAMLNDQRRNTVDRDFAASYFAGYGPASKAYNAYSISAAHPDPKIENAQPQPANNPYQVPSVIARAGRRLFVVVFKCSRADIYFLHENTGLEIRVGDLVIVEGDRGCDLGQVSHCDVSLEDAKKLKKKAADEQFHWLVIFSQYAAAGKQNTDGMEGALARAQGYTPGTTGTISDPKSLTSGQDVEVKPRPIKRVAQQHEIQGLKDKEGQEAKAKRQGGAKVIELGVPLEIVDCEYQADFHKLTFYYYSEAYVNFNVLVAELFKMFKVRIWMSAVNPASVINPAGMVQLPPPAAYGPGAILPSRSPASSMPVGPGFGSGGNRRPHESYGQARATTSAYQPNATYATAYDNSGYYAFANQLPGYGQGQYGMPPQWGQSYQGYQSPQQMQGRYNPYTSAFPATSFPSPVPGTSAAGSPMNYGAYYPPPTNYTSSQYFPATSGAYTSGSYVPNAHTTAPSTGGTYGYPTTSAGYDASMAYAFSNLRM